MIWIEQEKKGILMNYLSAKNMFSKKGLYANYLGEYNANLSKLSLFLCLVTLCGCFGSVARQHMIKGEEYFDRGLYHESIEEFNLAEKSDGRLKKEASKKKLLSYNELSMGLLQKKKYEEALRQLLKAKKIPGWSDTISNTMSLVYTGIANTFVDKKDYPNAIKFFRFALKVDPGFLSARKGLVTSYNAISTQKIAKKQFKKALRILDMADEIIRDEKITHTNRAVIFYKLGLDLLEKKEYVEAVVNFEKVKSLNPEFSRLAEKSLAAAHNNKGVELLKAGYFKDAIAEFNAALVFNSEGEQEIKNLSIAHCNLGLYLLKKGMYMEALAELNKALEVNPGSVNAIKAKSLLYNNRGVEMQEAGNLEDAIEFLNKAVLIDPSSESAKRNLAIAYDNNGRRFSSKKDFDSALVEFNLAVKYNPKFGAAYLDMALAYESLGKLEEAKASVLKAKELGFSVDNFQSYITKE